MRVSEEESSSAWPQTVQKPQYKARCLTARLRIGGGSVWLRWHVQGEWEDRKAEGDGDRSHGLGGLWRGETVLSPSRR